MKKIIIAFLLGNALVAWCVTKVAKLIYKANPDPWRYVWFEVFIPSIKNVIVDTVEAGVKRTVYGDSRPQYSPLFSRTNYTPYHNPFSRVQYNNPFSRVQYNKPGKPSEPKYNVSVKEEGLLISNLEEATRVREMCSTIIDSYGAVTRQDLYEMVGLPTVAEDNRWGWVSAIEFNIRKIKEGYLLEFPKAEKINQEA